MSDAGGLLAVYDRCLRTDAETPSAIAVEPLGILRLVTFEEGQGFITYPPPHGSDAEKLAELVRPALDHYLRAASIMRVEWKTRGHDRAPGLHEASLENGFEPDETESVMIGRAQLLDVDVSLPGGVSLREVRDQDDVESMTEMEDVAFDSDISGQMARALLRRLAREDGMELWVAEAAGQVVGAGRLEPVKDTEVAGIWGGAVLPEWRRRGIYRALTAVRARSALRKGKTLIHSDSTEHSRPILERAGLTKVTTTTPYRWSR